MSITGKITNLFADKAMTIPAFPRTKIKAVSDDNGVGLDAILNGMVHAEEYSPDVATVPLNAETLGGRPANDFALDTRVDSVQEQTNILQNKSDAIVDYIVEQGVSGIWTYRKWNSGIVECWGKETIASLAVTTSYGGIYHGGLRSSPSLPFTINNMTINVAAMCTSGGGTDYAGGVRLSGNVIQYYWVNQTSYSLSNGIVSYHIIGTWK